MNPQFILVALVALVAPLLIAAPVPTLIPLPQHLTVSDGAFVVKPDTCVCADEASRATADQLAVQLRQATGYAIKVCAAPASGNCPGGILLTTSGAKAGLGAEGYELTVTPEAVVIRAPAQAGLFYGVQTLRQLLPPQIFSAAPVRDAAWTVPCVAIEDAPRFGWRGLMLDSGHDFQNLAFVKRFIDLMSLYKLNVFHWHLTDLGTWSLEIKGYPELLAPGTRGSGVKPGYYTQDEIREVVRYAAERHITIVPEIDLPGHETAALLAYPELECPLPHKVNAEAGAWRSAKPWQFCMGNEKTFVFLEAVLSQVVELFPGTHVHIGGDECPKGRWLKCPMCQARMSAEHLATGEELQSYCIRRIEKFLESKGRRMIGWDEILEGGLAPNATVMSWRGMKGGIAAAQANHDVVMAPTEWTYFDYPNTPVDRVYGFEPVPPELTAEQSKHVLGAQAQMWTDNHPTEAQIDSLVYPRAAALSEVVWSSPTGRNYEEFKARLEAHLPRLAVLGVKYRPLIRGVPVAAWNLQKTNSAPADFEWPLTNGVAGPGKYKVKFICEKGLALTVQSVEIVQAGTVLASWRPEVAAGGANPQNEYPLELSGLSGAPLRIRASLGLIKPEGNRNMSRGRIYLEKQ